ncbi:MAG TPA: 6-pyruvoyl-tetrahydropterin synthase-related protein [Acidobacteriaceae bacterium]|nr:6-pyruvoyl-tetrahydropterin synthase-related protein [Acidobacteriaceae bacterium]
MKISFRFPATLSSEATRAYRRRSLLLAVIGIAVLPLAWRGPSCGQDFDFHLQNWLEVARSWRQGVPYPHWAASPNYLAGEPRFVFYPPLSRFLGAALGSVLPWNWTPLLFTLVCLLGAAWSFRAMAREWAGEDNAAIGACLYVVNPYMMFLAYERGAMAELMAAIWIPLLVLYGMRAGRSLVPLALTVAAIWLTNAPAAVMGCYMLAVLVLVAAMQQRSWKVAARAAAGVALGLALAAFWLVPAIYEQRWVQIRLALGPLMRVEDSFLFGYVRIAGEGLSNQDIFDLTYHNQVLREASWIVVALTGGAVAAAWLSRRRRQKNSLWLPLVIMGTLVCALQFRWSGFVWHAVPKLEFLQFPWRWMLVLGMIFAVLFALVLPSEPPTRRGIAVRALVMLLVAAGMAGLASPVFWQACDEEDNVAAQIQTMQSKGFEGTDEYTLPGLDFDEEVGIAPGNFDQPSGPVWVVNRAALQKNRGWPPPPDHALQIPAHVRIGRWQTEHMSADVTSPSAGYAVLRLTAYPAWRVKRNGAEVKDVTRDTDGDMAVPVEPGSNHIDVTWRTTGDQWAGIVLSLCGLAVTLAWNWIERRRKGNPVP